MDNTCFSGFLRTGALADQNDKKLLAVLAGGRIPFCSVLCYKSRVCDGGGNLSACTYVQFFAYGIMLYYCEKEKKAKETVFVVSVLLIGLLVFINPVNTIIDFYANIYAAIMILLLVATQDIKVTNEKVRRMVERLDRYSYTIYLGQGVIFEEIINKHNYSRTKIFLIGILGTGIFAYVVYNLYERPVYKALKGKKKIENRS